MEVFGCFYCVFGRFIDEHSPRPLYKNESFNYALNIPLCLEASTVAGPVHTKKNHPRGCGHTVFYNFMELVSSFKEHFIKY